jgi:hypothetical protein
MKSAVPEIPDNPTFMPTLRIGTGYYSTFVRPVKRRTGRKVGVIRDFEDISDQQRILHQLVMFNAFVAAVLWIITVGSAAVYLRRTRVPEITCAQIPRCKKATQWNSSRRYGGTIEKKNVTQRWKE